MTKPAKPEFTDYASAMAYIKAGRNPTERPTKDGWNTRLLIASDGKPHLVLHGADIATYNPDGTVAVQVPNYAHVTRNRLNRYVFEPRSMEMTYTTVYFQMHLAHRRMGNSIPMKIIDWPQLYAGVTIDERGIVGAPLIIDDETLQTKVDQTINVVADLLVNGSLRVHPTSCLHCRTVSLPGSMALADPEHLFSHVWDRDIPIELIAHIGGVMLTPIGSNWSITAESKEPLVKNLSKYIKESMALVRN